MSRYIDADALRDKLYEADAVTLRGVAIINNEPTVDAVPIDFLKQFAEGKRGYYSDFVIEAVKSYGSARTEK